jgi:tetratricopeptide (TPR) repeat protein
MDIGKQIQNILQLYKNKNYNKALSICEKLIRKNDKIPEVFNLYGLVLQMQNKHKQAINYFNKSISLNFKDHSCYNNLANSYKSLYLNNFAIENFEKCLKINPNYLPALINFAVLKKEINDHDGAIRLYKTALNIKPNPNEIKILFSLAELYKQKGEIENSKKILEKILELDSSNSAAHYSLSQYIDYKNENNHHIEMENLLENKTLKNDEIINFSFALGKAFEEKNDYEKSFNFYKIANDTKRKLFNHNLNYFNNLKTDIINNFEKLNISKIKKHNNKKIIFICGMPRSGTTLVEQIISSHQIVEASGENSILSNVFENKIGNKLKKNTREIKNFILSEGEFLNEYYFRRLDNLNVNNNIVTDKTVQNFIWIGFIRSLFPNCKIINCLRNPHDVCLSIYKNNFRDMFMSWSYKQEEIANFFNFYSHLMEFWNLKFPNEIYNLSYEDLLSDSKNEIKKLISFCDLPWDEECLNFYNNKTPVKTASSIQVRKPLYKTSKNLSKNYSKFLSSMFGALRL